MTHGKRVLRDIGFYSSSILATQFVTVVASVLTRRFLGPTQMGVWAFLQVLLSYAEYSALGTTTAASMEIPLHKGRGDAEKVGRITNAAFSFALISSLLIASGAVVYALVRREFLSRELFYGFLMAAGFVLLQRFNGLAITLVRAHKDFRLAGRQMFYSSVVNAALIALLSYRYKIYGFLAAMALSLLFNIVYLVWRAKLRPRFVPDWRQMASLVRYGLPLMTIGLLTTVYETLDRLFITRFLGFEALGLYSIALMAVNYLNGIPNSVGVVTISHLQEAYGGPDGEAALKKYLKRVDGGYGTLMAALIGSSWFLLPWLIHLVLPKFTDGIPALRCLVLGAFFSALAQGYSQLIYVIRKHRVLLVLVPAAAAAAAGANFAALHLKMGLTGVALATAFAAFVYFNLLFFYASLRVQTWKETFGRYLRLMGFFAVFTALLLAIDRWAAVTGRPMVDPWIAAAVFLACLAPVVWSRRAEFGWSGRG